MTTRCVRACGWNALEVYFDVKAHYIWEGNMITMSDFKEFRV